MVGDAETLDFDRLFGGEQFDAITATRGATFLVVAWPAFWWLDFYVGLARHLRSRYRRVFGTERLVIFDLRRSDAEEAQPSSGR